MTEFTLSDERLREKAIEWEAMLNDQYLLTGNLPCKERKTYVGKLYNKVCIRCKQTYETIAEHSKICSECNLSKRKRIKSTQTRRGK